MIWCSIVKYSIVVGIGIGIVPGRRPLDARLCSVRWPAAQHRGRGNHSTTTTTTITTTTTTNNTTTTTYYHY